MKARTSLFVIGILIAMIAASLLTVLVLFLTGTISDKPELEFTVEKVLAKEYDGKPLSATVFNWTSGSEKLKAGHKVEGRFYGSQTDVGTSDSDLRVKIYDENDRDVTGQYSVTVNNCELKVLQKQLHLLLGMNIVEYSGDDVFLENYTLYSDNSFGEETELASGHRFALSFPGFRNVGDSLPDTFTNDNYKIYDADGRNVTRNYNLISVSGNGEISIVPRKIKVKAISAEKYYDGTPVEQRFELISGTLVGNQYIDGVDFEDENGNSVSDSITMVGDSVEKVRVSKIYLYKQEGYNKVYLGEEAANNYELEIEDDVYGSFIVNKRPVTVAAKNLVKEYDGLALSSVLQKDEDYYTTDLPERFKLNVIGTPVVLGKTDVCDESYDLGALKITDGAPETANDVSSQFSIIRLSGIARITPITISIAPDEKTLTYTGSDIAVGASSDLASGIDSYIAEYTENGKIMGDALSGELEALKNAECNYAPSTVKNVGTYSYSATIANPNKNINVNFSLGSITVKPSKITAEYCGKLSKIYDGLEAKSILDIANVVLGEAGLTVVDASFKCIDGTDHAFVGTHRVQCTVAQIISESAGDVTQNYIVESFSVDVEITKRKISAVTNQAVVYVDSADGNINDTLERLRYSIGFSNLATGDTFEYYRAEGAEDFELDYNAGNSPILVSVTLNHIWNADGQDVIGCYDLSNADETIITVYHTESA